MAAMIDKTVYYLLYHFNTETDRLTVVVDLKAVTVPMSSDPSNDLAAAILSAFSAPQTPLSDDPVNYKSAIFQQWYHWLTAYRKYCQSNNLPTHDFASAKRFVSENHAIRFSLEYVLSGDILMHYSTRIAPAN